MPNAGYTPDRDVVRVPRPHRKRRRDPRPAPRPRPAALFAIWENEAGEPEVKLYPSTEAVEDLLTRYAQKSEGFGMWLLRAVVPAEAWKQVMDADPEHRV